MNQFEVIREPKIIFKRMLEDISKAKKSIMLETYIYGHDEIGRKFRDALEKKIAGGVKVYLLVDYWGSTADRKFFKTLIKKGARVKHFKEIEYVLTKISKNHERNHRKLLIIDSKISYVGSANITSHCLDWREIMVRIESPIAKAFEKAFKKTWNTKGKITKKRLNRIIHKQFQILQDLPRAIKNPTQLTYLKLISRAKKEILIETPYFIPSFIIRNSLYKAIRRGVKVTIIIPRFSDVRIVDIVRNRYLGLLHQNKINLRYFPKQNHSKILIVDKKFFILGSSNLDYRSFMHQYEINLFGKEKSLIKKLRDSFEETLSQTEPFSFEEWKSRSSLKKILELVISSIQKYL